MYVSQLWKLDVQGQGVSRVGISWGLKGRVRSTFLPSRRVVCWQSGVPRTVKASPPSLPVSSRGVLPVCVCVQISSSCKATGHIGLGLTLITIFIKFICQGLSSKWSQIHSYYRVRIPTCEFVRDTAPSLCKLCAGQGGDPVTFSPYMLSLRLALLTFWGLL